MVRRIGLGLALALAGLVLLFALALGFAQTGPGQRLIAAGIERALSGPETRAEVEGLRGTVPFDMALERVVLFGPEDEAWLRLQEVRLDWAPRALLRGRLSVQELSAQRIEVLRPPPPDVVDEEPDAPRLPELPDALFPVTIERLAVHELFVGEEILGRPATFRLAGSLDTGPAGEVATLALVLQRTDEPTAQASIDATLRLRPLALELAATASETGDLLAALTGRPEAGDFRFALTGSGPITEWAGRLEASAENLLRAEADLGIAAVEQPRLAIDLALEPAPGLVPQDLAPLLGERVTVAARMLRPDAQQLVVEHLHAQAALAEVSGEGRFDFEAEQLAWEGALEVADFGPLGRILELPLDGSARLDLHAEGDLLQPEGRIEVTLRDIHATLRDTDATPMRAERVETAAEWRILAPLTRGLSIAVAGEGHAAGLHLAAAPLPAEDWTWTFRGTAPAGERIQIDDFQLAGGPIRLAAAGEVDPERMDAVLDLALELGDIAAVARTYDPALGGRLDLRMELDVAQGGERVDVDLTGIVREVQRLPPTALDLLGPHATITAAGSFVPTEGLQVRDLELHAARMELTGDVGIALPEQTLSGTLFLVLPDLQALEPLLEQSIGGSLRLAASLGGTLEAPELLLEGQSPELLVADQVLRDVALRLTATDLLEAPQGSAELELTALGLDASLRSRYLLQAEQLALQGMVLRIPGTRVAGALTADLGTGLVDGRLEGEVRQIARLDPLLPMHARGQLDFDLRLSPENGTQSAVLALDGQELRTDAGAVRRLGLEATVTDVLGTPQIQATIDLAGARQEDLRLDRVQVEVRGTLDAFTVAAEVEGEAATTFALETSGEVTLADVVTLRLAELSGQVADEPLRLLTPAEIRLADGTIAVDPLRLNWARAEIAAEFRMAPEAVAAEIRVADLPMRVLGRLGAPNLSGRAGATLALSGTPADPRGQLDLKIADLTSPEAALADLPPLQVTASAQLDAQRLAADVRATGLTTAPVALTASFPVELQLQPFTFEVPPEGALQGQFAAQVNLARIDDLFGLDDQRLQGDLAVDLALAGTVGEPAMNGSIAIDDGLYENGTTGTVLRELTMRADATRQQIVIREFSATDGGRGRLTGEGVVRLDATLNYPYELEVQLREARLVRREDISATLGGRVQLAGDLDGAEVTGRIEVQRAEASIPEVPGPTVAVIEVEEVGGRVGPADGGVGGPAVPVAAFETRLDIVVDIPSQTFVRGRGLDSEWQGRLTVGGTAEEPTLVGNLSIRRGHFDFLDRRFVLRQGQIEFTGDVPPVPFIHLEAVATAQEITAIVRLDGPLTAPSITFESEPPLPQDEVLARLLFNRALGELGPIEAVRLAAALNRLRDGDGFDVFAEIRGALGLDVLDLVNAEDGVVRAGRYLGDDVYLEVERGIAEGTGRARVEVEIIPNLAIEADVGTAADTGVGVRWKYDF